MARYKFIIQYDGTEFRGWQLQKNQRTIQGELELALSKFNKNKKIRAAFCYSIKSTKLSRLHNNANIITLGARLINKNKALNLIRVFLKTKFEGGRHKRRIKKI